MLYMKNEDNIESTIKYYAKVVLVPDADPLWIKTLKELVFGLWRRSEENPRPSYPSGRIFADETMIKILKAAFGTEDSAFFEEAARCHKGKLAMDFFAWAQKQFACGGSSFAKVQDGYDFGLLRVGLIWQLWIAFYGPRLPILQAETYSSSALGSPDSIHFRQISELAYYQRLRDLQNNKDVELDQKTGPATPEETLAFVESLVRHSLDNDLIQTFWQRVVTGAPSISSSTFHYLRLPFMPSFLPFCQQSPAHPSVAGFSQTLVAILYAYTSNYFGLKPSRPPAISSAPRYNPVAATERRAHIHQKLDQARVDCTHETDHSRWTNAKLVVTKNFAQVGDSQLAWQQRKLEASKQIQSFDQVRLAILLPDDYENIVRMRALDVPSEQPVASRSESTPASMSQQYQPGFCNFPPAPNVPLLAGMKRTAEEADFVDLTLDD
ncbi:uncharacterized protein BO66DRAFT_440210 [Aspergillus aculeatinus CBS 121060]|uniref:Uncharacterized protein n=1 Tax=Aspergillus aculeatinus CBS 121060 TaxID=1448322 RepID=A0ACD1H3S9_9EURO|nr:hypothetical protein BO66DRAFT_440210 [Aspergillus aculeatinus CBS 121060]RAH68280.1 hypothetical protein BO66DRAFT_440210 [Aspergillus aculeatinus CBS 121060]